MTDVRLTATNPEDSSVVPVACNSKGELLVTEPVIEQIDNDVTINGGLEVKASTENNDSLDWTFDGETGALTCSLQEAALVIHNLANSGSVTHRRVRNEGTAELLLCRDTSALIVRDASGNTTYKIGWGGSVTGPEFRIMLEPENPNHYSSVRDAETGEETNAYNGPVIDVGEELVFLRAQLRALMEKLKMVPEGGWEVWDGSA